MMPSQALPHTYCQYMRRAGRREQQNGISGTAPRPVSSPPGQLFTDRQRTAVRVFFSFRYEPGDEPASMTKTKSPRRRQGFLTVKKW